MCPIALKEAIESALNQTYQNIEVLVINDGSNDNNKTEVICKSFGKKIRYFYFNIDSKFSNKIYTIFQ